MGKNHSKNNTKCIFYTPHIPIQNMQFMHMDLSGNIYKTAWLFLNDIFNHEKNINKTLTSLSNCVY